MINFDDVTKENIKAHNSNWLQISDHLCKLIITQGSASEVTSQTLIKNIYMLIKIHIKQNINS